MAVPIVRFISRRAFQAVPLLLLVSSGVFALIHFIPGGPLTVFLSNPQVRPEDIARLQRSLGLDRPLVEQYLLWLSGFIRGDWGFSFADGRPVLERVFERIPATVELAGVALLLSGVLSIPLGILTAVRRRSLFDHAVTFVAFLGISMPVFWLGLMMQLALGIRLRWLPLSGRETFGAGDFIDHLRHLVMPACALAVVHVAAWSRYLRSSMVDALAHPFVRTARAKGLKENVVLLRHVLRNALLPMITVISMDAAFLLSGAVITESVFAWPGVGGLFVDSIFRRDYTLIMGILMIGAVAVIVLNFFADLLYAWIDPRIRY